MIARGLVSVDVSLGVQYLGVLVHVPQGSLALSLGHSDLAQLPSSAGLLPSSLRHMGGKNSPRRAKPSHVISFTDRSETPSYIHLPNVASETWKWSGWWLTNLTVSIQNPRNPCPPVSFPLSDSACSLSGPLEILVSPVVVSLLMIILQIYPQVMLNSTHASTYLLNACFCLKVFQAPSPVCPDSSSPPTSHSDACGKGFTNTQEQNPIQFSFLVSSLSLTSTLVLRILPHVPLESVHFSPPPQVPSMCKLSYLLLENCNSFLARYSLVFSHFQPLLNNVLPASLQNTNWITFYP